MSRLAVVYPEATVWYVCSVTPIFLTAIGNRLASPRLEFDTRSKKEWRALSFRVIWNALLWF